MQATAEHQARHPWRWAAPLVLLAAGAWAWLGSPPRERTPQETERGAIELCWRDQARKSLPPDQAQFIASTCEMMEAKYRAAYGVAP